MKTIKEIIYKIPTIFFDIPKSRSGLVAIAIVVTFELGIIISLLYFELISFKGLLGLILFIVLSILNIEITLSLLIKGKVILSDFSSFLDFIYKGKAIEGFPHKEIYPNFHYYISHPFYHFGARPSCELNLDNIEINSLGFRGKEKDWKDVKNYYIYLSGGCQFFEAHLESNSTLAYMLEDTLKEKSKKEIKILNASCPHYTLLHSLNRFIVDLNRIRFRLIILYGGSNDTIAFLHMKNGKMLPDYTNLYKSFNEKAIIERFRDFPFVRNSKILQVYRYISMRKKEILHIRNNIETINPYFESNENIRQAERAFTTAYFENYLRMYINIARAFHIPLILTTANYSQSDMKSDARSFVASGIDQMNSVVKKLAAEYDLPIFDYRKEFTNNPNMIFNKWHYTKEGNELRAKLISDFIFRQMERKIC